MVPRLKRRLAPWIAWESYQRLTLSWRAAKFAQGALGEPPMALRVRAVVRAELERFAEEPAYGISPRFLERLESRTDLCVGGFLGGKLACYGFYSAAPTDIDEQLRFHFPERWLYIYKGFTLPEFRGTRLWATVLLRGIAAVEDWLGPIDKPLGFVTLVLSDNAPSLKALGRIGFERHEGFPVLRLGGRPFLATKPATPAPEFFICKGA